LTGECFTYPFYEVAISLLHEVALSSLIDVAIPRICDDEAISGRGIHEG
jgi:hypothetical protein